MSLKSRHVLIVTAFGAIAAAAITAGAGSANARSVTDCRADSRSKVISCCQQIVNEHRPAWMMGTGFTCGSAAACSSRKGTSLRLTSAESNGKRMRLCRIVPPIVLIDRGGDGGNNRPQGRVAQ